MPRYTYVVLTNAIDGRDDEFNDWYDSQHVADILAIPGFVAAERFEAAPEQLAAGVVKWRYLAIYTIETDDIDATLASMVALGGSDAMPLSPALDVEGAHAVAYLSRAS